MHRTSFIKNSSITGTGIFLNPPAFIGAGGFPFVRTPEGKRRFQSENVEKAIARFSARVKDQELAWLFGNCFPNALDTTVFFSTKDGRPDTYVITGDIDAMWLRDSTAQVWPYLDFIQGDQPVRSMPMKPIWKVFQERPHLHEV